MKESLADIFLMLGAFWMALSAWGLIRLRDFLSRLHATSKATSLGLGCLLVGVALIRGDWKSVILAFLIAQFIFLTSPLVAHLLAREYFRGRSGQK